MAEITLRHEINTDEDTFWSKCVIDAAFNKQMYVEHLKFPAWELLDMKDDDAKMTRKVNVVPRTGEMPGPIKKVIGDKLSYVEEGTFDKKAKRYTFKATPSTMPDKTKIDGEMWVEKVGDKKITRVCRIRVEVKVFMVGSMVEERILSDLRKSYDDSTVFTNEYLAKHRL